MGLGTISILKVRVASFKASFLSSPSFILHYPFILFKYNATCDIGRKHL